MKKHLILLTILALVCTATSEAQSLSKFKGTWEYTCNEAPEGFQTGKIVIEKKGDRYSSTTIYNDGSRNIADSIEVKNGTLIIETYEEGSYIKVEMKMKESKLTGYVYTDNGTLSIEAKKKK